MSKSSSADFVLGALLLVLSVSCGGEEQGEVNGAGAGASGVRGGAGGVGAAGAAGVSGGSGGGAGRSIGVGGASAGGGGAASKSVTLMLPETEASSEAGITPPALSCAEHRQEVRVAFNQAHSEARQGCTVDTDCIVTSDNLDCLHHCQVSVDVRLLTEFNESAASINDELCGASLESCAAPFERSCVPVRGRCSSGTCVTQCDQPGWPEERPVQLREGTSCGGVACPALPVPDDTRSSYAGSCCTDDNLCGISAYRLGPDCIPLAAAGSPDPECPNASLLIAVDAGSGLAFSDSFPGCCRPDGTCGLDTSRTWGAGCVSRSAFAQSAIHSCTPENLKLAELEVMACSYPEQ